jgi:mannose PTS system EIIA component
MAADGNSAPDSELESRLDSQSGAKCGVVLIGHGHTPSALLEAARAIIPGDGLADVVAIDAGCGQTPELREKICAAIERVDEGRGILLLADLMGSSPCMCGINESAGHGIAVVSGLNLAMLTKLAIADRRSSPRELAEACADSGRRSVIVKVNDGQTCPSE